MTAALASDADVRRGDALGELSTLGFHLFRLRDNSLSSDLFQVTQQLEVEDLEDIARRFAAVAKTDENQVEHDEVAAAIELLRKAVDTYTVVEVSHAF